MTGKACSQVKVGKGYDSSNATLPGPTEDAGSETPVRTRMNTLESDLLSRTDSFSQTEFQTWSACIIELSSEAE